MVVAANIIGANIGLTSTSFVWEEKRVPGLPISSKDVGHAQRYTTQPSTPTRASYRLAGEKRQCKDNDSW